MTATCHATGQTFMPNTLYIDRSLGWLVVVWADCPYCTAAVGSSQPQPHVVDYYEVRHDAANA